MKKLTVEEAGAGLGQWVKRALAGEQIQIRQGDAVVELLPARPFAPVTLRQPGMNRGFRFEIPSGCTPLPHAR